MPRRTQIIPVLNYNKPQRGSTILISLVILAVIVVIGVVLYFLVDRENDKRWKCVSGKCEKIIGGDYKTEAECKDACSKKEAIEAPPPRDDEDEEPVEVPPVYNVYNQYPIIRSYPNYPNYPYYPYRPRPRPRPPRPNPPRGFSYTCEGGKCMEITLPPGPGRYPTKEECRRYCNPPSQFSFSCQNPGNCVQVNQPVGPGRYPNMRECRQNCKLAPIQPPTTIQPPTILPVNPQENPTSLSI